MSQPLIDNLPLIAAAPDGIKALRGLILDLAVRGELVPQDPQDEPASELLKRIAAAKARNNRAVRNKVRKAGTSEAGNMELPCGWASTRLEDIVSVLNGRAYAKGELLDSGVPVLRVGNLFTSNSWYYSDLELEDDKYCDAGDLLFAWSASFGPHIWQGPKVIYHYHIWKLEPHSTEHFDAKFTYYFLLAKTQEIKAAGHGVSMVHMTKEKMEQIPVPLPPLAEQRRIVAKVDELMALCDRLEAQQADAEAVHATLVKTLLDTLTQSQNADDFAANWLRLSQHFPTIFTTEASADALKQTVLQLAIMGKLVRQNPDDGPVEELFDPHVRNEMAKPCGGKGSFVPFAIPESWAWARLDDLLQAGRGISYGVVQPEKEPASGGIYMLRCSDVKPRYLDLAGVRKISEDIDAAYSRTRINGGEVLINIRGTIGGVALATPDVVGFNIAREVAIIPLNQRICGQYIVDALASPYFSGIVAENLRGLAYQGINLKSLREFLVPLPPLAEQHRIVAKVDELLALCDTLKAQIADSRKVQRLLAVALIDQTLAA